MTPKTLRAHIRPLPEYLPRTTALEAAIGVGFDGAWYRSQKEHWLGWLSEYDGPGAYGRTDAAQRNGRYIYNHRHTIKDLLRDAGIEKEMNDFITGHSSGDTSGDYGRGPSLANRSIAIDKIDISFIFQTEKSSTL